MEGTSSGFRKVSGPGEQGARGVQGPGGRAPG